MTSTDITTTGNDWEAILPTIRHMYANGATDPEFRIFCETAKLLGLNPMLKQIWCVKNANRPDLPAQIYASRDGFLAIAHRSGQFDGMQSGVRKGEDGEMIGWCRIWRKDMSHPFEVEILRSEYDTGKGLWAPDKKPQTMTIKVAEAHCLRRAFDICGVYTPDEMPEPDGPRVIADTSRPVSAIAEPPKAMTKTQPAENCRTLPDAEPVLRCDVCGRSNDEYPALPIRERDGTMICGPCQRKAEKEMHVPSSADPAPAPGASGAVCEECGAALQASEEKMSRMFVSRLLCKKCLQHVTGPQPGEPGHA